MKSQFAVAMMFVACVGVASCGNGGKPKGQVVAKVGKDEITVLDLQSELGGFKAPNPQIRKAAEQQALNAIVQRKLLAQAAEKNKLDKTPEYARLEERTNEALLVKTWQDQLVRAVPTPSVDEAQKFVNEHPELYSARKRFTIQGVRFAAPNDPTLAKAIQPLNTLEEVQALLTERKIPFAGASGELDAFAIDPRMVEQLMKLKPGDVFVLPQNNLVFVGTITATRDDPVANPLAMRHATEYLRQRRVQETVSRQFGSVVQSGLKEVQYAKAYEPPKPAKAPASRPAAGAPAASPAVPAKAN
jgi:EpsD family peptidyl-prolyl cis-trans isomerase